MQSTVSQQLQRTEQQRLATERLVADVRSIIDPTQPTPAWTRTKTDLVELVHLAWLTRQITDPYGRPCTQRWLAQQVFGACGIDMPRSLTHVVWKINNRYSRNTRSVLRAYMTNF